MRKYSFLFEDGVPSDPPGADQQNNQFDSLIKSPADIPLSKDGVERLKVAAQIRQIEAKTKEIEAKAMQMQQPQMDPNGMGGIDPNTGMPMDPNGMGGIDPNTGMPMNPNGDAVDPNTGMPMDPNGMGGVQNNDPLRGLGDRSSPPDPMGGAIDPMTGMPMGGGNDSSMAFTALGRAQKLKDIYTSLLSLQKILKKQSDDQLQKLYKQSTEVINLLKLVINNLKSYKDQIDSLIIMYYDFLKQISEAIESIMKEKKLNSEYE